METATRPRRIRWLNSVEVNGAASLHPGGKGLGACALAGIAFREGQDRPAVIVIEHGYIEPGALLQELNVSLKIRLYRREADEEIAVGDLHGQPGQSDAPR